MRVIKNLWPLPVVIAALYFAVSCHKDNDLNVFPPDEVTMLKAEPGNASILLTWNDPEDEDFEKVIIQCGDTGTAIPKGVEHYQVTSLKNDTIYRFTVRTVDTEGNRSRGRNAHAKPEAPPEIQWLSEPETHMDTSYQGELTGGFFTTRTLKCNEGTGYIDFRINTLRLEDDTAVVVYDKRFLVYEGVTYRFELEAKADITVFQCTECEEGDETYTLEIVSLADGETFSVTPSACMEMPVCNNGKYKKEIRWNIILVNYLKLIPVQ